MKKKKSESTKQKSEVAQKLDAEKTRISTSNVRRFNEDAMLLFDPVKLEARPEGVESLRPFLEALFEPSDWVVTGYAMHEARFGLAGELNPPWAGNDLPKGAWVKVNPVQSDRGSGPKGGVTDEDCILRHVMLELDRCPLPEQHVLWSLLIAMGLPVVTLVHSRGKSLHAVLRVSARNLDAYRAAASSLCTLLLPFLPDTTSRNPSRFTRLPGFGRGGKGHQDLLYVNPDAAVWTPAMPCNDTIRSLTAGLEAPPPKVRESLERAGTRAQREETEESRAEDKEFRKWASGLDLKGGLDMEHLVQSVGWKSCDAEKVDGDLKIFVQCPWSDEHSGGGDDDGEKDAYIFERKGTARFKWGFHCSHDSCQSACRGIRDVFELLQEDFESEFSDSLTPNPDVADLFDEEPEEAPATVVAEAPSEPEVLEGTGDLLALASSEYADSELFRKFHGKRIRYLHDEEKWLIWGKGVWRRDDSERIREMAKDVSRKRMERAKDEEEKAKAARSGSSKMIDAILKTTRSVKGIASLSSEFDANPWLLGCQNGVLDLRTGVFTSGDPKDGVSLRCGVSYVPGAVCPRFREFIHELFPNHPATVAFLKRWFGYSLSGVLPEQHVLILYGHGRNGKSTLLDVISSIMGEYGINSPKSLLIGNPRGEDPGAASPALADLKGKRAAFVSETEADAKLSESRVKDLTSGEPIRARQLHQGFFTLKAAAKVVLSSNHEPRVHGTDTGIWRRLLKVEFREDFTGREDASLQEILHSEREGILNWMLEGFQEWQDTGLAVPEEISWDTQSMKASMDVQGQFLGECCSPARGGRVMVKDLYSRYRRWAGEQGMGAWSSIAFNRKMKDRKFTTVRINGYDHWDGLMMYEADLPA